MDGKQAIKMGLEMADMVCMAYLSDLSDADLMKRPHAECNTLNWQLGHLITSEHEMIEGVCPGSMPALPAGFAEKYSRETVRNDDSSQVASKDQLMAAYQAQRKGTLDALSSVTEARLSESTEVDYAPTVGSMFSLQGSHWLMHCGQWVVVRRMLGKPVVM